MQTGSLELMAKVPEEKDLYILTEFFKMLGNPTRIHILLLLMEQDGCVSSLAERLGMTQSAVSHQLSLLKSNKLVKRCASAPSVGYGADSQDRSYASKDCAYGRPGAD